MDWSGMRAVMWFGFGWIAWTLACVSYFCWALWGKENK